MNNIDIVDKVKYGNVDDMEKSIQNYKQPFQVDQGKLKNLEKIYLQRIDNNLGK